MSELKACPHCGGEVSIKLTGNGYGDRWFITRGYSDNACRCRLFMESEKFSVMENSEYYKEKLAERWNTRVEPEPRALTLEKLKKFNIGDWVWIEHSIGDDKSGYFKVQFDYTEGRMLCFGYTGFSMALNYGSYGKTWLAYDRQLA